MHEKRQTCKAGGVRHALWDGAWVADSFTCGVVAALMHRYSLRAARLGFMTSSAGAPRHLRAEPGATADWPTSPCAIPVSIVRCAPVQQRLRSARFVYCTSEGTLRGPPSSAPACPLERTRVSAGKPAACPLVARCLLGRTRVAGRSRGLIPLRGRARGVSACPASRNWWPVELSGTSTLCPGRGRGAVAGEPWPGQWRRTGGGSRGQGC
jgi:hypothetical protein